jgi:hypothetical protein
MAALAPLASRKSKAAADAKQASAKPKARHESAHSHALHPPPLGVRGKRAGAAYGERVQTKLSVSEPDDVFEREADHVADHVMKMSAGGATPPPASAPHDEERELRRMPLDRAEAANRRLESEEERALHRKVADEDEKSVQRQVADEDAASVRRKPADEDEKSIHRQASEDHDGSIRRKPHEDEDKTVQRESKVEDDGTVRRALNTGAPAHTCTDCDETVQRACAGCEDEMQRACSSCGDDEHVMRQGDFFTHPPPQAREEEEPRALQKKSRRELRRRRTVSSDFQWRVSDARRGGGEPLPAPLRRFMETRFAQGFERVRIHRDGTAADLATSVNARAFTLGQHVFFNAGEFQPQTQRGQRLVAHELTHVLQQRGGMHSVQREVLEPEPVPEETRKTDQEQKAGVKLDFEAIAKLFDWRKDVLPPLVFDTLRELLNKALNVVAFRESLAVFGLPRSLTEDVRRILTSPHHELELELERRGPATLPRTRYKLTFLDGEREPAKGGEPLTIHTDEDSISVPDTSEPKPIPAESAPSTSAAATSTTSTAVNEPTATSTAGAPEPTNATAPATKAGATSETEATGATPNAASAATPEGAPVTPATSGKPGTAAAAEPPFPSSPEDDPNFRAVTASAQSAANTTSEHSASGELAANAKDAATVTPGEQQSKAEGNKTDEMQAAKTPGFDKAAFVQAVLDKVRETAPHSLPEAANFGQNKAALASTINQTAGTQTDRAAGELKSVTDAAPNAAAVPARPAVELAPEAVGKPPADLKAERAVPPEQPKSHVEGAIAANEATAKSKLDDLGLPNPERALANANDPKFSAALEAKKTLDADAAAAPGAFRTGEQKLRTDAMSEAGALGKTELGSMVAARTSVIGQVVTGQRTGKSSSEKKRADVIAQVNTIFATTATNVKTTLANLKSAVNETFQTESQRALDTFTRSVEDANRRWNDKTFLDRAAEKVGSIFGIPTELEADLQAIRNAFIDEMKRIVENIAATVERELAKAKQQIADGRAELKKFLDGLDPSLGVLRDQLGAEFNGKFGTLETEVRNTEKGLVTDLAAKFKGRLDESDKLLSDVREQNKGLLDDVVAAVAEVKDAVLGMVARLQQVFADGVETLLEVLANPVTFAKNFLAGVLQGFENFAANIGTHLKAGLIEWLTGSLAGAGITLPQTFDLKGIVGFILQLLGLTVENVKARARVIWGDKIVRAIELGVEGVKKAAELFTILENEGVSGLFNFLKEKFVEFKDIALQKIKDAVALELVEAAVKKIATLLVPGGAILQAVLSIVDAVFFFIRNAEKFASLIQTITSAVKDILAGNVGALAAKVESVLARTIPVVLDFLASLIGIGGKITETIQKALKAVTEPIQNAIDAVLLAIKKAVGGIIDKLIGRGGKEPEKGAEVAPGTPMTEEQIIDAVVPILGESPTSTEPAAALAEKQKQADELKTKFQPSAPQGKTLHIEFKERSPEDVERDAEIDMEVGFSPGVHVAAKLSGNCGPGEPGEPSRAGVELVLTPARLAAGGGSPPSGKALGQYPDYHEKDKLNRSHVLGDQLGGRGRHPNLVLTSRDLNSPGMRDLESQVAKGVRAGRKVEYTVAVAFGGAEVPVDRDQAVTIARGAGFSNPSEIKFEGTKSLEDVIPTSVTISAKVLATCPHDKLAEGDALLTDFTHPLTEKPLVVARRRAAVANAFAGVLRD